MMMVWIGEHQYEEKYLVECDRELFGPFDSKSDAVEFAMARLELPWTLLALNTPPREGG